MREAARNLPSYMSAALSPGGPSPLDRQEAQSRVRWQKKPTLLQRHNRLVRTLTACNIRRSHASWPRS
jgi:hypothetical protein